MRRHLTPVTTFGAAIVIGALSLTACAGQQPGTATSATPGSGSPGSAPAGSATATQSASSPPASPGSVSCPPGDWRTAALTVDHQISVPPVPVASDIATGTHPGCEFDRLVIHFSDAVPGYSVSFVKKVIQDASGDPIAMRGSAYLEIRFSPAQGHTEAGKGTLPTGLQTPGYRMLQSYTVAGDFEGELTIALGLAAATRYRVGELPGLVYVDVAW